MKYLVFLCLLGCNSNIYSIGDCTESSQWRHYKILEVYDHNTYKAHQAQFNEIKLLTSEYLGTQIDCKLFDSKLEEYDG